MGPDLLAAATGTATAKESKKKGKKKAAKKDDTPETVESLKAKLEALEAENKQLKKKRKKSDKTDDGAADEEDGEVKPVKQKRKKNITEPNNKYIWKEIKQVITNTDSYNNLNPKPYRLVHPSTIILTNPTKIQCSSNMRPLLSRSSAKTDSIKPTLSMLLTNSQPRSSKYPKSIVLKDKVE